MSKKAMTPDELEAQADALLAAADNAKASPSGKAAASAGKNQKLGKNASHQDAARVLTDEEAKKAGIVRLDDKQVAALPAASWLMGQEKLRELLARGKKKGKLDSGELMEAMDDLNLESDQMDQLYDSLEALNIDIGTEADLLPELNDDFAREVGEGFPSMAALRERIESDIRARAEDEVKRVLQDKAVEALDAKYARVTDKVIQQTAALDDAKEIDF